MSATNEGKPPPAWLSCKVCIKQMCGEGPRCWSHNPAPKDNRPPLTDSGPTQPVEQEEEFAF